MTITLSEFIDQVREELLTPRRASTPEAIYPFLFVEEVELEVNVTVTSKANSKGKVSIQVVEVGAGIEGSSDQSHRVKVKLTPLISKDEIRVKMKQDKRLWEKVESVTSRAITKEDGLVGEE